MPIILLFKGNLSSDSPDINQLVSAISFDKQAIFFINKGLTSMYMHAINKIDMM